MLDATDPRDAYVANTFDVDPTSYASPAGGATAGDPGTADPNAGQPAQTTDPASGDSSTASSGQTNDQGTADQTAAQPAQSGDPAAGVSDAAQPAQTADPATGESNTPPSGQTSDQGTTGQNDVPAIPAADPNGVDANAGQPTQPDDPNAVAPAAGGAAGDPASGDPNAGQPALMNTLDPNDANAPQPMHGGDPVDLKAPGHGDAPQTGEGGAAAGAPEKKEEGSSGSGVVECVLSILKFLTTIESNVTLKAPVASALPKGKTADDFQWMGVTTSVAEFPKITSLLGETLGAVLGYAKVEIHFYSDGHYISDFGARLVEAQCESLTSSLEAELTIDHFETKPASGIAHIDWILTFRYSHLGAKKVVTVSGRANGDGTRTDPRTS